MKIGIKKWTTYGIVYIIIFGTLLHFAYEWSGNNSIVGIFGSVNESTWEHLKLLFWPAFIFSIVEFICIGRHYKNYIAAKAVSFYIGIFMIISLVNTYTGVVGKNFLVLDISIFIASVISSQYMAYKIIKSKSRVGILVTIISIIAIILLVAAFVFFTFNPLQIPLFKDPSTGGYGI